MRTALSHRLHPTLVATAAALALLTGCSGSQDQTLDEAEKTLEDYLVALTDGDTDACDLETERYASENDAFFDTDKCSERVKGMQALLSGFDVDFDGATYEAVEGDSDTEAIVTVTSDDDSTEDYLLVYDDDRWLVDDEYDEESGDDTGDSSDSPDSSGSGEGGTDPEEDEPDEIVLPLTEGSSVTLPGADDGMVSDEVPFTVVLDTLTCAANIPDAGFDDSYGTADLVPDDGNQICVVELAVTNDSKKPATFSSSGDANIRLADGTEFSVTDESFNDQGYLADQDRKPSFTTDEVQPGETAYDVVAYELPEDVTPTELVYEQD